MGKTQDKSIADALKHPPSGLNSAQLAQWKKLVQDPKKGIDAANAWAKSQTKGKAKTDTSGGVDIDATIAQIKDQMKSDFGANVLTRNPEETDQYGNKVTTTYDPTTGKVIRTVAAGSQLGAAMDEAGKYSDPSIAPRILTTGDLAKEREAVFKANYDESTKYLDKDQAVETERKKQELANRGIVFDPSAEDPNSKTGYAQAIHGILNRYDSLRQSARNDAEARADAAVAQQIANSKTAHDAWLADKAAADSNVEKYKGTFGGYQAPTEVDISPYIAKLAELKQQGKISDRDYALKVKEIQDQHDSLMSQINVNNATAAKLSRTGGSSSGGSKSGGGVSGGGGFGLET